MSESLFKFSLLICTYAKDNPVHLAQCLDSVLSQTVLPDELIIVKDGPLLQPLETVINSLSYPNTLTILALPKNVSLGLARAEGVKTAMHKWIALMDSDDICLPTRFEKQLDLIKTTPNLSIIGCQIIEFDDIPGNPISTRSVPPTHDKILARAKYRNPFNAMTTIFNRDLALKVGNFRHFPGFEDYDLWMRIIANEKDSVCTNHPEALVHARIGNGMYARRKGISYIKSEWHMQKQLKRLGITNNYEFARNILARIPIRLLPGRLLAVIYKAFARS